MFAIVEKAAVLNPFLFRCSDGVGRTPGKRSFNDMRPCTEGYVDNNSDAADVLVQVDWAKAFVKTTPSWARLSI
jgi:hypothetical protein